MNKSKISKFRLYFTNFEYNKNRSYMDKKKKIVVLSGAGMSKESGLDTFRDSDGLWAGYNVEEVASIEGFHRNPKLVLDFYNLRRKELLKHSPNKGHQILADMENDNFEIAIITQNVDDYHEKAGSTNVLHLHGELMKARSINDDNTIYDIDPKASDINIGDLAPDGYQLRPHIVWFGESVPKYDEAIKIVASADIFVVIGTSLNVYPAAGLLAYVPKTTKIYLIDPKQVHSAYRQDIIHLEYGASEGLERLRDILQK